MFARFAFNGGASLVLVYGNSTPAKVFLGQKDLSGRASVSTRKETAGKVRTLRGDADSRRVRKK